MCINRLSDVPLHAIKIQKACPSNQPVHVTSAGLDKQDHHLQAMAGDLQCLSCKVEFEDFACLPGVDFRSCERSGLEGLPLSAIAGAVSGSLLAAVANVAAVARELGTAAGGVTDVG